MERSQRLARINALLQRRQGATMAQLIDELEVTRATINRDLALMKDQMNAPIQWDRRSGTYRLAEKNQCGPAFELPGLWLTPQQAYAFLTLQNMVEKIAPKLLGPFLDPIRGLLKRMLAEIGFEFYGLDKKVDIAMPAMPSLGDLDFSNLLEALVNDQKVRLTFITPAGEEKTLAGLPAKLRITPDQWLATLRPESGGEALAIDVGQIRKVVLLAGEVEEE